MDAIHRQANTEVTANPGITCKLRIQGLRAAARALLSWQVGIETIVEVKGTQLVHVGGI
jgi:hypothetical protein